MNQSQSFDNAIPDWLLEILRCPNCKGEVRMSKEKTMIECQGACGYRYPVEDGIPRMLVDEAIKP